MNSPQTPPSDAVLLAALRTAPRRFRMPALPATAAAAASGGAATALAYAMEAARTRDPAALAADDLQALFTKALAALIEAALASDPGFQADVMRAQEPLVRAHVDLASQHPADVRAVRITVDTIAHPGKLRGMPPGAWRDALARLHASAAAQAWEALAQEAASAAAQAPAEARAALNGLRSGDALARLLRGDELLRHDAVRRYQALGARRGPLAGSEAAATQGRASAREGDRAEHAGVQALEAVAGLMNDQFPEAARYRVVHSLRTPGGFPGAAHKAKEEWDAAIVRASGETHGADALVLLAEIKASPAAASADLPRLLRGLQRLAQAEATAVYAFASADGEVRLAGASLRALLPKDFALPPQVIYCCAAAEATMQPPHAVLSAASRAVLLGEPASLAFAQRLASGEAPPRHEALAPVWQALTTAPHLRAALHQYDTARTALAAMLHPDDLAPAVARALQGGAQA